MTAYTVITICNTYGIKMREQKISIHQQASWMNGTTANLKVDEEFYIIDLLYGLLLPSGNDAGVALAQYFGKFLSFKLTKDEESEEIEKLMERFDSYKEFYDTEYQMDSIKLFVFEMNKNGYKIGLKNTQFANPTGLSNSKNFSTARDIATLTSHCLKNHLLR
jgi:serine-type D-Ala-D-Ala carboxypeptidase (penicillin-binding protein 5/6)